MPISQALYTGVTGLSVNADGMSVIANNIANANAKGFNRDRAEFEDMLSMDMQTGAGASQIGRGARDASPQRGRRRRRTDTSVSRRPGSKT